MTEGLGFGRRKLIKEIITKNWNELPESKKYTYGELLYVIQEMMDEEGKAYFDTRSSGSGHHVFRDFTKHLLYRNLANYDSMILLTSEKGCTTHDGLLEMPRDLKKYPRGVPLKELIGKGPQWVYSFNVKTRKLEVKKCDGVEFVKEADVYEIELLDGRKLKVTDDHPFLLMNGTYKQLKDLFWIDRIRKNGTHEYGRYMENGKLVYTDRLRIFCRPSKLTGDMYLKIDYSPIDRKNGDTAFKHCMMEHRFIAEQIIGNIKNKLVHHENEKHYDNIPENLKVVTSKGHHIKHEVVKRYWSKKNKFCYSTGYSTKKKDKPKIDSQEFIEQCREKRIAYCENNKDKISNVSIKREANKTNSNSNHINKGGIIK